MEYTYKSRLDKFAFMARELYGITGKDMDDTALAEVAVSKTRDFLESVERYITLSDVGITDDSKFDSMAEDTIRIYAADKKSLTNPKPLFKEDIVEIFKMCR
jgi:alcohol dehydrogenase YqhD (iron-dependent ADH family)